MTRENNMESRQNSTQIGSKHTGYSRHGKRQVPNYNEMRMRRAISNGEFMGYGRCLFYYKGMFKTGSSKN